MTYDAHLTAEQIARYQTRTLVTAELLAVDRHLAACAECRSAIYREIGAQAQLDALRSRFSEHLTYEQVAACAQGSGDAAAEAHLKECASCREEVEDLRVFAVRKAPVVITHKRAAWVIPAWIAAAAAIVVLAGSILRTNRPDSIPTPQPPLAQQQPTKPAEADLTAGLTAEQRDAVAAAISTHRFERAPILDRLVSRRGVLLGGAGESKTFDLTAPIGTSVTSDRPTFRWQALPGATRYVVSVFDESFRRVAESPAIGATEWQPSSPLPRGRIYIWQVTATVAGEAVRSPVPPAPEARFQVAGPGVAASIQEARRSHPGNHLLLAVLLARNGALDETAMELDELAATDPAIAQSLRESLAQIRRK
ncbi:MAG TPA: hypothetical protein VNV86_00695 [Candidatus Acidoferrum sp.]|nr:hypothetical protein [Candidatus Acidoferrum sp.]